MDKEMDLHQEYLTLEQRLRTLDIRLANALQRIRHCRTSDAAEQARRDERVILTELDRLMTRARAIEGQLLHIRKKAPRH